ncbi:MAG: 4Fe-4S dicluster domain-containing protein [Acidobacteria bacterium]|nr:4Fe-4S dicluster domain-containing protein [Acidobacteriota bacterium]
MAYRVIGKTAFLDFLKNLAAEYEVVGPVQKAPGTIVYRRLDDASAMVGEFQGSLLPPKKFFFPQKETLLRFDLSGAEPSAEAVVQVKPVALVGVHPCDLHGLQRLDRVFADDNPDPNYLEKREQALVIGMNCLPDDQCFCASMGTLRPPEDGFDLFLTDTGDRFAVEIGSEKGEQALDRHAVTEAVEAADVVRVSEWYERKEKAQKLAVRIPVEHLPLLFKGEYHAGIWDEHGKKCLSCGACNLVCPTCYCFDVRDDVSLADPSKGERTRVWDGCQLEEFARVAGGENFREHRSDRNRHRFYRKFLYPVLKYKKSFCVGCGRCVRSCLVHISVVETVNHFVDKSLKGGAQ